jgi:tetratricopeptide (TPR) repeat protein
MVAAASVLDHRLEHGQAPDLDGHPPLQAGEELILDQHDAARGRARNGLDQSGQARLRPPVPGREPSLRGAQRQRARGMASVLYHLGKLEMSRGDATAAAEFFRRSLTVGQRTGDHEALGWTHCSLGEALHALADHNAALTHLHQGLFHAQHAGDRSAHAANLSHIAAIHRDRGDHRAAIAYCQQALTDLEETPNAAIRFDVETRLAEIDLERGEVAAAREHAQDMLAAAHRSHDAQAEVHILEVLGNAHGVNGEIGDRDVDRSSLFFDLSAARPSGPTARKIWRRESAVGQRQEEA